MMNCTVACATLITMMMVMMREKEVEERARDSRWRLSWLLQMFLLPLLLLPAATWSDARDRTGKEQLTSADGAGGFRFQRKW